MSNIDNVNDIILDLNKIDSLYREFNAVEQKVQEVYRFILDDDTKDFIRKQTENLPKVSDIVIGGTWSYPPDHWWKDTKAKRDEDAEKYIEKSLTCEAKDKLYNDFRKYDEIFLSVVKECNKRYSELYEHRKKELIDQKENLEQQLNSITLLPKELFGDAARISTMLKQKRADTLKEAINLAFEEKRKDREEHIRQREASRQEALLEQQAKVAQAQLDSQQAQLDSQREANYARCNSCVNQYGCSSERKKADVCQMYVKR